MTDQLSPIIIAVAPNGARKQKTDHPALPLGKRIKLGMSSSPGCPPHSKPSTETASHPMDWAFKECLTEVHL